jgi:hypothetical protein
VGSGSTWATQQDSVSKERERASQSQWKISKLEEEDRKVTEGMNMVTYAICACMDILQ